MVLRKFLSLISLKITIRYSFSSIISTIQLTLNVWKPADCRFFQFWIEFPRSFAGCHRRVARRFANHPKDPTSILKCYGHGLNDKHPHRALLEPAAPLSPRYSNHARPLYAEEIS